MTGHEHYLIAEDFIRGVEDNGDDFLPEGRAQVIALAQVHATLALAAATALSLAHPDGGLPRPDREGGVGAASAYKRPGKATA